VVLAGGGGDGGGRRCVECGVGLSVGVRFCAECGARQPGGGILEEERGESESVPAVSESSRSSSAGGVASVGARQPGSGAASASGVSGGPLGASGAAVAAGQSFLLPRFPFRLVWSPRKPWVITTRLSEAEVGDLFTERMTRKANLVRQANNYFRRVKWRVSRNAISGELVANCDPDGPVAVGFGSRKWYLDVSRDTLICRTESSGSGQVQATVGTGTYTTLFGLYVYPAPVYAFDVVKAIKQADRSSTIKYPWSPIRMVALAIAVILLIAAASGSSSNNNTAAAVIPSSETGSASSSSSTPTEADTSTTNNQTATTTNNNETSTGTAASRQPSPPTLPGASRTIKEHLERLAHGDYGGAFALMSYEYRSQNPGWLANREQGDPEISVVGVGQPHYVGKDANVYVKFYARDRSAVHGSDTRCRLFKGTVFMAGHGGTWRYEPSGNKLSGSVVADSSCRA
jgi:hypothetical protein